jgi:hypothetical protein
MFDEIIEWVSLLFLELILAFSSAILIIISVVLYKFNHFIIATFLILIAILFIGLLIGSVRAYIRCGK